MSDDPYVTVRRAIVDDPRYADLIADRAALGTWLLLRIDVAAAWPASAATPAWCPSADLDLLAMGGYITRQPNGRLRMPDIDEERTAQRETASKAGKASGEARRRKARTGVQRALNGRSNTNERHNRTEGYEPGAPPTREDAQRALDGIEQALHERVPFVDGRWVTDEETTSDREATPDESPTGGPP